MKAGGGVPFGSGIGGFVLGPANNIFGNTGSSADKDITAVTIAANRATAEATRNAYDTANAGWLAGYTDIDVNIILYYESGATKFLQYQRHVGTSWLDNGLPVAAIKGDPGTATDFSAVGAGNIPVIGSSPGFDPGASGISVLSDGSINMPAGARFGNVDLNQAIRQASGIEEVCYANIVRLTQSHPPLQRAELDQSDRVYQKEWAAAAVVDDVRQAIAINTLVDPTFNLTVDAGGANGIRIADFQVNFAAPATEALLTVTRGGVVVYRHNFGAFAVGVQRLVLMSSPGVAGQPGFVDVMDGDVYSFQVSGASLLGNSSGVPYYTLTFRAWNSVGMAKLSEAGETNVQADWNEVDTGSDAYINNKPSIPVARTDEDIRDVVGATLVAGMNISIDVDDTNNQITISATGGSGGGTPPPAAADIIYYGLSNANNPASVDLLTLTQENNPTNPDTISTGVATDGQYFILLVPQADDITSIFDTVLQQDVTSLFTETDNVRVISTVSYKSYVIGPLNAGVNEEYVINFGSTP